MPERRLKLNQIPVPFNSHLARGDGHVLIFEAEFQFRPAPTATHCRNHVRRAMRREFRWDMDIDCDYFISKICSW